MLKSALLQGFANFVVRATHVGLWIFQHMAYRAERHIRLLPHELAKLAIPELELDTLRRLVERQTLCREHHATEPVGKGPIIVTVDESGSMQGEKVHTAKALALALAWIARQQGRWSALVAYSGDSGERLLALPPGR